VPRRGIFDVSERNDIVLDPFLGSGATVIAADRAGRRGYRAYHSAANHRPLEFPLRFSV